MADYWKQPYPIPGRIIVRQPGMVEPLKSYSPDQYSPDPDPYPLENKPILCRHGIDVSVPCIDCNPPPRPNPDIPPMPNWPVAPDGQAYSYIGSQHLRVEPGSIRNLACYPQRQFKVLWVWVKPGPLVTVYDIQFGNCSATVGAGEIHTECFNDGRFLPVNGMLDVGNRGLVIVSNGGSYSYNAYAVMVGTYPVGRKEVYY